MTPEVDEVDDPATSAETLACLANHADGDVRCGVALNPRTPVDVLLRLVDDEDPDVRSHLAHHAKLPVSALRRLAADDYPGVRASAAGHPPCEEETLEWLSQDPDVHVRSEVAYKRSTPLEALLRLEEEGESLLEELFANSSFPDERIAAYIYDESAYTRLLAITSRRLSSDDLRYLAAYSDVRIRLAVATDPATPVDVLHDLLEFAPGRGAQLDGLVGKDVPVPDRLNDWLLWSASDAFRVAVAENPSMPTDLLLPCYDPDVGPSPFQDAIRERLDFSASERER